MHSRLISASLHVSWRAMVIRVTQQVTDACTLWRTSFVQAQELRLGAIPAGRHQPHGQVRSRGRRRQRRAVLGVDGHGERGGGARGQGQARGARGRRGRPQRQAGHRVAGRQLQRQRRVARHLPRAAWVARHLPRIPTLSYILDMVSSASRLALTKRGRCLPACSPAQASCFASCHACGARRRGLLHASRSWEEASPGRGRAVCPSLQQHLIA